MKFEIFQKSETLFSFELIDAKKTILLSSVYESFDQAVAGIKGLIEIAGNPQNYHQYNLGGQSFFSIKDGEKLLVTSNNYESLADTNAAIALLANETFQNTDFQVSFNSSKKGTIKKLGFEIDVNAYDFTRKSVSGKNGFEEILEEKSYFFHFNNADGKVLLFSQPYSSAASRSAAIRSVIQNAVKEERFEIINEGGKYFFILKAQTGREMARSASFKTEAEAKAASIYLSTDVTNFSNLYPKPVKKIPRENMENNDKYNFSVSSTSGMPGFESFQNEETKQCYFHFNNAAGSAILFSQGYQGASGRDNGIRSVIKNAPLEERYSTAEENGKFYFVLKAGNKQEIARSRFYDSEAEMLADKAYLLANSSSYASAFGIEATEVTKTETFNIHIDKSIEAVATVVEPVETVEVAAVVETVETKSANLEDDYLVCSEYRERITDSKSETNPDFITFQHQNSKYYFALLNSAGDLYLRSEGYPTTAARDNGIQSVIKNSVIQERYGLEEKLGFHFLTLKAGNHQEIARSCPFSTADEATARRTNFFAPPVAVVELAETKTAVSENEEDDYLVCGEYRERIADSRSDKYPNFITFQHQNGKYYFALLDDAGDLHLRSEGYPTTAARDNGIESVIKNSLIEERYSTEEKRGFQFLILKAGNHKEIARSCPYRSTDEAAGRKVGLAGLALAGLAAAAVIPAAAVAAPVAEVAVPVVEKDKGDNYLTCNEYKNHKINDKQNNVAFFKHKNGQFYFVVYNKNGSVRLRSEGFGKSQDRDQELKGVLKNINDETKYTIIEKEGLTMKVLKDASGKEIARSCPEKGAASLAGLATGGAIAAAALAGAAVMSSDANAAPAKVAAAPSVRAAAPIVEEVAETSGGLPKWLLWLLLAALLGLLAWWLLKGCEKPKTTAAAIDTTSVKIDTVLAAAPVAAASVCNCSGNAESIFNIPAGKVAKKLARLGTNPEFARYGKLHGKTPAEFLAFLKGRYTTSAVDKAFLDRITKAMGYTNGFGDLTEAAITEQTLPIGTKGNLGWGAAHNTGYDELPDAEIDRQAFKIASNGGCDLYFMKTCGNHMFPDSNCK